MARLSINPGDLTEQVKIQTPEGESASDDRDATGFVDQHGGTNTAVATIWAAVRELNTQEIRRAGGEAGQRFYSVTIHNDETISESDVILRVEKSETLEIVSLREITQHSDYLQLLCKRAT